MLFNKFVPSYHHHFGHQCKVSDYGFTKLIELFEAIPDVVEVKLRVKLTSLSSKFFSHFIKFGDLKQISVVCKYLFYYCSPLSRLKNCLTAIELSV